MEDTRVSRLWHWLLDPHNRGALKLIGGAFAAVVAATWTLFVYLIPAFTSPASTSVPTPTPLGSFMITVKNQSDDTLYIDGAEYYIQVPDSPGSNRTVVRGLVELENDLRYSLQLEPKQIRVVSAKLKKESDALAWLEAENGFILIILTSSPRPLRAEVIFS